MKKALHRLLPPLLGWSCPVLADQIILKNQDRLSGTISGLSEGKLSITTSYAGDLKVDWSAVSSITVEAPAEITFSRGEPLLGTIRPEAPGQATIEASDRTRQVSLEEIVSLGRRSAPQRLPHWLRHWKGKADLGFSLTRGSLDVENLSAALSASRQTSSTRLQGAYNTIHHVVEDARSNTIQVGSVRFDRFLGAANFFVFALAGFDTNERQDLDLRTREGGGFGYTRKTSSESSFSFYGGMTLVQERFGDGDSLSEAQGLAAAEVAQQLWGVEMSAKAEYEPRFQDDRFLLRLDLGLKFPVVRNLSLGVFLFDYYDSDPASLETEGHDYGLLTTLGWRF